jgi:hypothetical protein
MERAMTKSATTAAAARQADSVEEQTVAAIRRLVTPRLIKMTRTVGDNFPLLEALVLAKWLRPGGVEEAMQAHTTLLKLVRQNLQDLGVADEPYLAISNLLADFLSRAGYRWSGKRGWIPEPMRVALEALLGDPTSQEPVG